MSNLNSRKRPSSLSLLVFILLISMVKLTDLNASCTCGGSPTGTIGDGSNMPKAISGYVPGNGIITSGCYIVKGFVYLDINILITGGRFEMEAGAEIRVPSGKKLTIRNVTDNGGIYGCDALWRGLNITTGGTLEMNGTIIQDAQYAVKASGTANIMINNNTFLHNYIGVYIPTTGTNAIHNVRLNAFSNTFDAPAIGGIYGLLRFSGYSGISPSTNSRAFAGFEINNANIQIGSLVAGYFGTNTVQHMRVGVYAKNSTIQCDYLTASNLIPYYSNRDYTGPDGIGILAFNTTLVASHNTISNCLGGITGNGSWLKDIYDNEIYSIDVGILDRGAFNSPTIINNSIQYFRNRGIEISKANSLIYPMISTNSPISTNGTSPTTNYNSVGIKLNLVGNRSIGGVLEYNDIHIHSNGTGIHNNAVTNIGSGFNDVRFDDLSQTATLGIGILHTDSKDCFVIDNSVIVEDEFENITCFYSEVTPNTIYCCNGVSGATNGYVFSGNCRRLNCFSHNVIDGEETGVYLDYSSVIGKQFDRGNNWNDDNYSLASAIGLTNAIILYESKFYIESCDQPLWPPTILPTQADCGPGWFTLSDGESEDCNEDSGCDPIFLSPDHDVSFAPLDSADILVSRGQFKSGEFGFSLDYESRKSLFERMWFDPSSHSQNAYIDSFYSASSSSTIADFNNIARKIDTLLQYSNIELDTIESIVSKLAITRDTMRILDSLFYLSANLTDSTQYITLRDTSMGLLDSLTLYYQQVLRDYKTRVLSGKSALIYLNSIITPINKIDSNEQIVNDLYLTQLMEDDFHYDSMQGVLLLSVAKQCPREGGSIIYKARILYQIVKDTLFDDSSCKLAPTVVRSNKDKTNNIEIIYSPNPAHNSITLELIDLKQNEEFSIAILDLNGRDKFTQKITNPKSRNVTLTIPDNLYGIYIATIKGKDDEILHKQKLVFVGNR
ncbi:MAG: T9SS type A sorting domain-containing protein [Saprospiraceae bacterium]|nr:T9SS type A sorting domain-containing protein [Saprospiraceae bacterium]